MAIDDETLELLERRLAEKVEARVRGKLFKLYGGIGSGILAGFGLLGYDLYGDFKDQVRDTAKGYAEAAVKGSVAAAEAAAGEARAAAEAAETQARDAGAKLSAMDEWRHLGAAKLQGALETVGTLTASVDGSKAELEDRLTAMRTRVDEAEGRIENARARGESYFLNAQYEQVILDLSAEVERMDQELEALTVEARQLQEAVWSGGLAALAPEISEAPEPEPVMMAPEPEPEPEPVDVVAPPAPEPVMEPAPIFMEPPRQTAVIQEKAQALAEPQGVTIFVQYDGVPRAVAERLARGLSGAGYDAPGVERLDSAATKHELRFFYEEDRPRADAAALAADEALATLGYRTGIEVRLFDKIRVKPRPGVFELWIDPVAAR